MSINICYWCSNINSDEVWINSEEDFFVCIFTFPVWSNCLFLTIKKYGFVRTIIITIITCRWLITYWNPPNCKDSVKIILKFTQEEITSAQYIPSFGLFAIPSNTCLYWLCAFQKYSSFYPWDVTYDIWVAPEAAPLVKSLLWREW